MAYYHQYGGRVNHKTPIEEGTTYCGKNTSFMDSLQYYDDGNRPLCLACLKAEKKKKTKIKR